ncbi:GNAT family N-acetyltransferase [Deinococcus radiophilus]|uniref:GNAT family N-acetyltransferase n=1 Tax=Deinococcus radiophilus TaxID=32062 RepID=A0A431VPS8_9DEIO|nr:GNAT family N-acetyltransferase [Deinococcus radiophilus]RTR25221.1 GNAT family N-acetyltransferase [Deinococcus radiophilus]UFA50251.1 GNAT family N-acetyltransferase [Deinococcus radiophilus]
MTLTLHSMSPTRFAAYVQASSLDYAAQNVRAGRWSAEEAEARAAADYAQLLPQGVETPGHHLYLLLDDAGQEAGVLWYAERGEGEWFIYDFAVHPPFQGQGYGQRALESLRELAQRQGVRSIGLHVFGHNDRARRLYERLGFETVSVLMRLAVPLSP